MKRLHVHVAVDDLARSTAFYSTLFAAEPVVVEADYAKWMLDDPKVNFAISARGRAGGIDHLGLQVETAEELAEIAARLKAANEGVVSETDAACCYARSDKEWAIDPQGVRWESFLTHGQITTYGEGSPFSKLETIGEVKAACCAPPTQRLEIAAAVGGCTLSAPELAVRLTEIAGLNRTALRHVRRSAASVELIYDGTAAAEIDGLIERERTCCAGLSFAVRHEGTDSVVTIGVPAERSGEAEAIFAAFTAVEPAAKPAPEPAQASGCCGPAAVKTPEPAVSACCA